jgi:putative glutamine amidotransferase
MKIAIIPSIKETYKNQFEYCVDIKLINFLKRIFTNGTIEILTKKQELNKNFKILIISGGNDLYKFSKKKKDLIRSNLDNYYYKEAISLNIPILGICYGAQFIATKFKGRFKKKNHTKKHYIKINNYNKNIFVNSYHKYILTSLSRNCSIKGTALDKSIEFFQVKKIIGIMWHPERYKNLKLLDKKIIKDLTCS